jgi:hypothetical protein
LKTLWSTATQRAILGVEGGELNATASKALGINQTEGFYVGAVTKIQVLKSLDLKKEILS